MMAPGNDGAWASTDFKLYESMTSRIRNLQDEYRGNSSFFKEFLANADDAGATSVAFVLDANQYGERLNLWNTEMEAYQAGPALLVYNDARFQDPGDFYNMKKGFANSKKREDDAKIGKYGLGVTTAFGFSDMFTVLSQRSLLLLDPHEVYLTVPPVTPMPQGGPSRGPGSEVYTASLKFDVGELKQKFPGQLLPFERVATAVKIPDLAAASEESQEGKSFNGTLFRFPLRSKEAAERSEISKKVWSASDVEQVFLQLLPDIPDLLLFLKNLREVKLCIIPEGSQDAIVLSTSVRVDNPLPDISLPAGWECSKKVIKTTTLEQKQPSSGLLSDAQKTISSERAWFRILDDKAAVAILLNNELPLVGQIYCGMPLPISKTNLVVHINGMFKLHSNRKEMWAGTDAGDDGSYNQTLLVDHTVPLWARAIQILTSSMKDVFSEYAEFFGSEDIFYRLWPMNPLQPSYLQPLSPAFAEHVIQSAFAVLWCMPLSRWVTFKEAWFFDRSSSHFTAVSEQQLAIVADVANRIGLAVVDLPGAVQEVLFDAAKRLGVEPKMLTQQTLSAALKGKQGVVKFEEAMPLIHFLLGAGSSKGVSLLDGLHIVPLTDGTLGQFILGETSVVSEHAYFVKGGFRTIEALVEVLGSQFKGGIVDPTHSHALQGYTDGHSTNIMVPSAICIARALPSKWAETIYGNCLDGGSNSGHPQSWLDTFWAEVESPHWKHEIPHSFSSVRVVPMEGGSLASPARCRKFNYLPGSADLTPEEKGVLTGLGCQIAANARGELVGGVNTVFPLLASLAGAAEKRSVTLENLISFGSEAQAVRTALCRHLAADSGRVMNKMGEWDSAHWRTQLSKLKLFELLSGGFQSAKEASYYGSAACAPTSEWEDELGALAKAGSLRSACQLLKVHGVGKENQKQLALLRATGIDRLPPTEFYLILIEKILPGLAVPPGSPKDLWGAAEAVVLKALDFLQPCLGRMDVSRRESLKRLPLVRKAADGSAFPASRFWDPRNAVFRRLFAGSGNLLPDCYSSPSQLAVLEAAGLQTSISTITQLQTCILKFHELHVEGLLCHPGNLELSKSLLQAAVTLSQGLRYNDYATKSWLQVQRWIPVHDPKGLLPSSKLPPQGLVSLQDSYDERFYSIIASAIPVTASAGSSELRGLLGIDREAPALDHVLQHVVNLMKEGGIIKSAEQDRRAVLPLLEQAYASYEALFLAANQSEADLKTVANRLQNIPWILLQSPHQHVLARQLCFGAEEDQFEGFFPVPKELLALVAKYPVSGKQLLMKMGAVDADASVQAGVKLKPKQNHEVNILGSGGKPLVEVFDNESAFPDARIWAKGRSIWVHKVLVAHACEPLAAQWRPGSNWSDGEAEHVLQDTTYPAARAFLRSFYSGTLDVESSFLGDGDLQEALLDVLRLADLYRVPWLIWECGVQLVPLVRPENVCAILEEANRHQAEELKDHCVRLLGEWRQLLEGAPGYNELNQEMKDLITAKED